MYFHFRKTWSQKLFTISHLSPEVPVCVFFGGVVVWTTSLICRILACMSILRDLKERERKKILTRFWQACRASWVPQVSHCCHRWWIPSPAVSYGNRLCFQPTAGYVNGLKPRNTPKPSSFQEKKRDSVIWHSASFSTAFHAIRQLKFTKPQNSLLQILGKSTTWAINFILKPARSLDLKLFKKKYLMPADFYTTF